MRPIDHFFHWAQLKIMKGNEHMKNQIRIVILIALMFFFAFSARAEQGDTVLFFDDTPYSTVYTDDNIMSITGDGETLYMLNQKNGTYSIKIYEPSTGEMSTLPIEMPDENAFFYNIAFFNGNLIGYAIAGNRLNYYVFKIDSNTAVCQATIQYKIDLFDDYQDVSYFLPGAVIDDYFYIAAEASHNHAILRIDLRNGEWVKYDVPYAQSFTPYRDGKALVVVDGNYTLNFVTPARLQEIDLTSGELTDVKTFQSEYAAGVAYDAYRDMIFYADEKHIRRVNIQSEEDDIFTPMPLIFEVTLCGGAQGFVLQDKYYAYKAKDGVLIRAIDRDQSASNPAQLVVDGSKDEHGVFISAFANICPDVTVTCFDDYISDDDYIKAMLSGDSSIDIYRLTANSGVYKSAKEKGFLYPLDSDEIMSDAERMYPHIREAIISQGKPAGVVSRYGAIAMGYQREVADRLGIAEQDLPRTWLEFLKFASEWPDAYGYDFPDASLFFFDDFRYLLLRSFTNDYISLREYKGEPVLFDTEMYRELLAALEKVDFSSYTSPDSDALFEVLGVDVTLSYVPNPMFTPRPITFIECETAVLPAYMDVYVINPHSQNLDAAVKYLETIEWNMDAVLMLNIFEDYNDPIDYPYYQYEYDEHMKTLGELNKALESADETKREDIKEKIIEAEAKLQALENDRYLVSPEQIAAYRAIAKKTVLTSDIFNQEVFKDMLSLYLNGQLTADQFVQEMDRVVRMMELEEK
jgi:ABC-type glycerol-3-phosphate transport system substrate-binding protein